MAKYLKMFFIVSGISLCSVGAHGQIIIAAIFGDELNSGKIEFGLDGGYNPSWFSEPANAKTLNNFNIGFFFHIKLTENSFVSTGVHVKSNVGASGLAPYSLGDPNLDAVFAQGERTTKISIFYVPILWQQRFNRFYIEGGIQPGLRSKVRDIFTAHNGDDEVEYTRNVSDDFTRLDFGLTGGVGFRFLPGPVSSSMGVSYYQGLVDVYKPTDQHVVNSTVYVYGRIPIGAGKKKK